MTGDSRRGASARRIATVEIVARCRDRPSRSRSPRSRRRNGSPERSGGAVGQRARDRQQHVGVRRQRAAVLEHALELARAPRGGAREHVERRLAARRRGPRRGRRRARRPRRAASTCRDRWRAPRARTGRAARARRRGACASTLRTRRTCRAAPSAASISPVVAREPRGLVEPRRSARDVRDRDREAVAVRGRADARHHDGRRRARRDRGAVGSARSISSASAMPASSASRLAGGRVSAVAADADAPLRAARRRARARCVSYIGSSSSSSWLARRGVGRRTARASAASALVELVDVVAQLAAGLGPRARADRRCAAMRSSAAVGVARSPARAAAVARSSAPSSTYGPGDRRRARPSARATRRSRRRPRQPDDAQARGRRGREQIGQRAADLVLEPALDRARAVARIERVGDGAAADGGARVDERVALAQAAAAEQLRELLVDDLRGDLVRERLERHDLIDAVEQLDREELADGLRDVGEDPVAGLAEADRRNASVTARRRTRSPRRRTCCARAGRGARAACRAPCRRPSPRPRASAARTARRDRCG